MKKAEHHPRKKQKILQDELPQTISDDDEASSSDEEETLKDTYELQYSDNVTSSLPEKIALLESRKWKVTQGQSSLGQVLTSTLIDEKRDGIVVKKRLADVWNSKHKSKQGKGMPVALNQLQTDLFQDICTYRDLLYGDANWKAAKDLEQLIALHTLNHVYKTRDKILRNSEKIRKATLQQEPVPEMRDQGFTRPKVLILLPFKNSAYSIVNNLIQLSGTSQQENKKRFMDEFHDESTPKDDKPEDYKHTFRGNVEDSFRMGIKLTRKTMKLYSEFYSSDILVASPLGLRLIVGEEGDKKRDFDFLSSIEVLIMYQTDVMLMQNWSHVQLLVSHLNRIPKENHDTDFSRVKNWYLDQGAKYLRQTIVFTSFLSPEINGLFNGLTNVSGKIKTRKIVDKGTIGNVSVEVSQLFQRLDTKSIATSDDERFKYFTQKVLDPMKTSATGYKHTLIFVASYVDFVRLRNYLEDGSFSFATLSEYSNEAQTSRNRARFFNGQRDLLLITERMHFFRRFKLRGVKHVIFYSLPDNAHFYNEVVDFLSLGEVELDMSCKAFFTPWDRLKLERIVGDKRAAKMLEGQSVFMFS